MFRSGKTLLILLLALDASALIYYDFSDFVCLIKCEYKFYVHPKQLILSGWSDNLTVLVLEERGANHMRLTSAHPFNKTL